MKTKPIHLKKSGVVIQFVEENGQTYLLEEKLKPRKCVCCGDEEPKIRVIKQNSHEQFLEDFENFGGK